MSEVSLNEYIRRLPKAELHVHICGTIEPEMLFKIGRRNGVSLPYSTIGALRDAYRFNDLTEFLTVYSHGTQALQKEEDFYEITMAFLKRAAADGVVHAEPSIDPQTFVKRGIDISIPLRGMLRAMDDARDDISSLLVMDFIREFGEPSAIDLLKAAKPYLSDIAAVGLGSVELGHPPSQFKTVYAMARDLGLRTTAHAGEEGPPEYVREAMEVLKVDRIDHGVRAAEDPVLLAEIAAKKIPLTLCPLSNQALKIFPDLREFPLREIMDAGIVATINSDDPPYFGGYINENYHAVAEALSLTRTTLKGLAENSIKASFLPEEQKTALLARFDQSPD